MRFDGMDGGKRGSKNAGNSAKNGGTGKPKVKFSREFIRAQMTEQEKHLQQVNKALEKDNAKLQEDNQYLKQLLKLQKEVTGGTKFTKSSVETMARQLKTKANASGETKELATILNSFYEFIATSKELTWEDVMEKSGMTNTSTFQLLR